MPTQRKIDQVAELTDKLSRAQLMLVTDYRGLTVAEITALRAQLRKTQAELIVAKNTLVQIAAKETGHEKLDSLLAGPTAVAIAYNDINATAKAISDFNRVEFFTSHEALLLCAEAAQTRRVPRQPGWYNLSTHFPWIGMSHRKPAEFLKPKPTSVLRTLTRF